MTDPTNPFFGLTFPLRGITTTQRPGRVCVTALYPGIERVLPIGATDLEAVSVIPPRCRLSLAGLRDLPGVVASLALLSQESTDARDDPPGPCGDQRAPTALPPVPTRTGTTSPPHDLCDAPLGRVWNGLTPLLRTQVRQTALRILREVLDDQQP